MSKISIKIFDSKSKSNLIATLDDIDLNNTILSIKKKISLLSNFFFYYIKNKFFFLLRTY